MNPIPNVLQTQPHSTAVATVALNSHGHNQRPNQVEKSLVNVSNSATNFKPKTKFEDLIVDALEQLTLALSLSELKNLHLSSQFNSRAEALCTDLVRLKSKELLSEEAENLKRCLQEGKDAEVISILKYLDKFGFFTDEDINYLIHKGVDFNQITNSSCLLERLIIKKDPKGFDLVIRAKADPHIKNESGDTLLHKAAPYDESGKIFKILLTQDVDVNALDEEEKTALHLAAHYNNSNGVRLLLEKNANPNIPDINNKTALHFAAEYSNSEIVTMLLEKGAAVDAKNNSNKTPLCMAILKYQKENNCDNMLLLMNADKDCDNLALNYALLHAFLPAINLLKERARLNHAL